VGSCAYLLKGEKGGLRKKIWDREDYSKGLGKRSSTLRFVALLPFKSPSREGKKKKKGI